MAGDYEAWFSSPGFGPNWMHDPVGNAYWGTVGKIFDEQMDRMKTGLRCRNPSDALALGMSDALDQQGRDRLMPRGGTLPGTTNETDASYADRLLHAWDAWSDAGRPKGLLVALKAAGFPTGTYGAMIINHIGIAYTLSDGGDLVVSKPCGACANRTNLQGVIPSTRLHGFTLDLRDQFFSHFLILFQVDVVGLYDNAGNYPKAALNQTVQRWRCGGAFYNGAAVVPSGKRVLGWPPTINVGDSGMVVGANQGRFINPE